MPQRSVREYDAKKLMYDALGRSYAGVLITSQADLDQWLQEAPADGRFVIKPDQLFGKRGKLGVVGADINPAGVQQRRQKHNQQELTISRPGSFSQETVKRSGVTDRLHTFLIEPFISHTQEYYLSFSTSREYDLIRFSTLGGVNIEEHWESVQTVHVGVLEELTKAQVETMVGSSRGDRESLRIITDFVIQAFRFFRTSGFVSLEVNPFVITSPPTPLLGGEGGFSHLHCLDMVAQVDSCETRKHPERKNSISRVRSFGIKQHPAERLIEEIDDKTGASLKLTIINPEGRLRFLLGGGGASVVVMDTLAKRGWLSEVANYGELSGNPDEESNLAYVQTLLETMFANNKTDQYLCLIGGIANFTDIVALVRPLTTMIHDYAEQFRTQRCSILMRRGGLRVDEAMQMLATTCQELGITYKIVDDDHPMTDIFDEVHF